MSQPYESDMEPFEVSRRIASFVKFLDEQGVEGAAGARRANMDLAAKIGREGFEGEAGALVYLLMFAFEAGRQTGMSMGISPDDVNLAQLILSNYEQGNDPRAESRLLAERIVDKGNLAHGQ